MPCTRQAPGRPRCQTGLNRHYGITVTVTAQLPLALKLPLSVTLDDFSGTGRDDIIAAVNSLLQSPTHAMLYLWGADSTGKSHLLSAACVAAQQAGLSVAYLPLAETDSLDPAICEGLEHAGLLCLDDVERVAGDAAWEHALFNLYNRIRDGGNRLIISSRFSPTAIPVSLADLKSRLAWGTTLALRALNDAEKRQVLQQRAQQWGLQLPDDSTNYLLNHHARGLAELIDTLEQLERASLAAQRRLTLPFVRDFLRQHPS